jgi:hypothetical protein
MNAELITAIRNAAAEADKARDAVRNIDDGSDELDEAAGAIFDAAELARCLARLLEGKSIHDAFGAPGDWGYHTKIGQALYRLYSEPSAPAARG